MKAMKKFAITLLSVLMCLLACFSLFACGDEGGSGNGGTGGTGGGTGDGGTTPTPTPPPAVITVGEVSGTFTYNGEAHEPTLSVTKGETALVNGTDYDLTYANNVNAGTASVTVDFKGEYAEETDVTKNFTIAPKAVTPIVEIASGTYTYNGSAFTPAVTVRDGGEEFEATDFEVAYANNTNAGTATVTVTLKGNYAGTKAEEFTIAPKTLTATAVEDIASVIYNGEGQSPVVHVYDGSKVLILDTDYTVAYENNTNAGTATAIVTFKGNYAGSAEKEFTINKKQIAKPTAPTTKTFTYDGTAKTYAIEESTYYTVSGATQTNAGTYTVTVALKNTDNIEWTEGGVANVTFNDFTIATKKIAEPTAPTTKTFTYDGTAKTYALAVNDSEYTIAGATKTNAGTYTVTVELKDKNNTEWANGGVANLTFDDFVIEAYVLKNSDLTVTNNEGLVYSGAKQTPTATVNPAIANDVTLTNNGGTNVGSYKITVEPKTTNVSGKVEITYTIATAKVNKPVAPTDTDFTYNGQAQTYGLVDGDNYSVQNATQTNANTYTVKAVLDDKSNYEWVGGGIEDITFDFIIKAYTLKESDLVLSGTDLTYNGANQKPTATVASFLKASDYTITNAGGTNKGSYSVTLASASANVTGTPIVKNYEIKAKAITPVVTVASGTYTYNGSAFTPAVTVKDGETALSASDYEVAYTDNTNAGTATVTVTLKGNYEGTKAVNFTIGAINASTATFTVANIMFGATPVESVSFGEYALVKGVDYEVDFGSYNVVGWGKKATLTFINNFTGTVETTYDVDAEFTVTAVNFEFADLDGLKTYETSIQINDDGAGLPVANATLLGAPEGVTLANGKLSFTEAGINAVKGGKAMQVKIGNITKDFTVIYTPILKTVVDISADARTIDGAIQTFNKEEVTVYTFEVAVYADDAKSVIIGDGNGVTVTGAEEISVTYKDNGIYTVSVPKANLVNGENVLTVSANDVNVESCGSFKVIVNLGFDYSKVNAYLNFDGDNGITNLVGGATAMVKDTDTADNYGIKEGNGGKYFEANSQNNTLGVQGVELGANDFTLSFELLLDEESFNYAANGSYEIVTSTYKTKYFTSNSDRPKSTVQFSVNGPSGGNAMRLQLGRNDGQGNYAFTTVDPAPLAEKWTRITIVVDRHAGVIEGGTGKHAQYDEDGNAIVVTEKTGNVAYAREEEAKFYIYLDGVLVHTVTSKMSGQDLGYGTFYLGGNFGRTYTVESDKKPYISNIDNFFIYTDKMTATEVRGLNFYYDELVKNAGWEVNEAIEFDFSDVKSGTSYATSLGFNSLGGEVELSDLIVSGLPEGVTYADGNLSISETGLTTVSEAKTFTVTANGVSRVVTIDYDSLKENALAFLNFNGTNALENLMGGETEMTVAVEGNGIKERSGDDKYFESGTESNRLAVKGVSFGNESFTISFDVKVDPTSFDGTNASYELISSTTGTVDQHISTLQISMNGKADTIRTQVGRNDGGYTGWEKYATTAGGQIKLDEWQRYTLVVERNVATDVGRTRLHKHYMADGSYSKNCNDGLATTEGNEAYYYKVEEDVVMTLYIDGVKMGSFTNYLSGQDIGYDQTLYVGGNFAWGSTNLIAGIDNLVVLKGALTDKQVAGIPDGYNEFI